MVTDGQEKAAPWASQLTGPSPCLTGGGGVPQGFSWQLSENQGSWDAFQGSLLEKDAHLGVANHRDHLEQQLPGSLWASSWAAWAGWLISASWAVSQPCSHGPVQDRPWEDPATGRPPPPGRPQLLLMARLCPQEGSSIPCMHLPSLCWLHLLPCILLAGTDAGWAQVDTE